jgi:hypothetical protein
MWVDRVWMLWILAEALADDAGHWMRRSLSGRERGQGLVEYAFTIISVIAVGIGVWALLQVAMNAMGQRAVTAVNNVK